MNWTPAAPWLCLDTWWRYLPDSTKTFSQKSPGKKDLARMEEGLNELREILVIIACASRSLTMTERNYSATELEFSAVKWGIWKMRDYFEGYRFTVLTDHLSLKWLGQMDNPSSRLDRWAMELNQWDFTIKYRRGSDNLLDDTLSRQPIPICEILNQKDWYHRWKRVVEEDPAAHPEYIVRDGKLYRHILHTLNFNDTYPGDQWKVYIPRAEQANILREAHDQSTAGYLELAKTLVRLARQYYWPGMLRMVAKYVRTCASCQKHKVQ